MYKDFLSKEEFDRWEWTHRMLFLTRERVEREDFEWYTGMVDEVFRRIDSAAKGGYRDGNGY